MVAALGLDVGRKRIGVAGCDRLGWFARGLTTIHRRTWTEDMAALRAIVRDREVEILVLGLPYNMDGSLGSQAKSVQKFGAAIVGELGLAVEFVDERLTSFAAEQRLVAEGRSPRNHKALIDQYAAEIILQQWLDQRKQGQKLQ
jgi:putative Holliday junction resolvase